MLPKSKRLNLKVEFKQIVQGKRIETSIFKIFGIKSIEDHPKVGISLSKKEFSKAHDRNRARRISSQAIQSIYDDLPKGLKLIIIPKEQILSKTVKEITQEFKISLTKLW